MPEIKRTFQAGRMNKDLDERLVPQGEYRDALNIEVRTSGDSDVGTVQSLYGTIERKSYNISLDRVDPTTSWHKKNSRVVGSVVDDKTDSAYFFVASPSPFRVGVTEAPSYITKTKLYKDMIIRYDNKLKKVYPVATDIFRVEVPSNAFILDSVPNVEESFEHITLSYETGDLIQSIRPGMKIACYNSTGAPLLSNNVTANNEMGGVVKVREVSNNTIYFDRFVSGDLSDRSAWIFVDSDPALRFHRNEATSIPNIITGINIIDNLLFWTDDFSEPKKINIDRLTKGVGDSAPKFNKHSLTLLKNPTDITSTSYVTVSDVEDPGAVGFGIDNSLKEEHITVIRKAPRTAPKLLMNQEFDFTIPDYVQVFSEDLEGLEAGGSLEGVDLRAYFDVGSILTFTNVSDPDLKFRVLVEEININSYLANLTILSIGPDVVNATSEWAVDLIQDKAMFEDKFIRFSYRYKYQDGEYSSFAPWSEYAFVPGKLDFTPKKGYNLGMLNNLRSLKVIDFVNEDAARPDDVVAVDILMVDTVSPNVRVVKTINRGKDSDWDDVIQPSVGFEGSQGRGVVEITTEMIHRTLESSQSLRAWDNVPRVAKAQEVTGNRILYGNYLQGYDVKQNVTVYQRLQSEDHLQSEDDINKPKKSIKSMRNYKIGVVFGDKYGRETPVMGVGGKHLENIVRNPDGSITTDKASSYPDSVDVGKKFSASKNKLKGKLIWGGDSYPSEWMEYYKYYVKETSNEYYNLVMDRWYEAEDGNVWLSFQSADRNKVDEETHLILKREHLGNQDPVLNEEARYKVLAIENEAPDFIKTTNKILGVATLSDGTTVGIENEMIAEIGNQYGAFSGYEFEGTGWARIRGEEDEVVKYSEWIKISRLNDIDKTVSVVKPWGNLANMDSNYGFGTGSSPTFSVQIKDSVVDNDPEFDGRFFVKIYRDGVIDDEIISGTLSNQSDVMYSALDLFEVSYISTQPNADGDGWGANDANPNADLQGDYTPANAFEAPGGPSNYTGESWDYDGSSGSYYDIIPEMYGDGCGGDVASNAPIFEAFWQDYWSGTTNAESANKWFIDNAHFLTVHDRYQNQIQTSADSTSEELSTELLPGVGGIYNDPNFYVWGRNGNIYPANMNAIMFSKVSNSAGVVDYEFKQIMMTSGTKFRFKADPGCEDGSCDPQIYIVRGSEDWGERRNYFGDYPMGDLAGAAGYCYACTPDSTDWACNRHSFSVYFHKLGDSSNGLDTNNWDPKSAVASDGSTLLGIEIVESVGIQQYTEDQAIGNAVWETEPKEDVDLDLYYEATEAIPIKLKNDNIQSYIPLFSKTTVWNLLSNDMTTVYDASQPEINVKSVARDVVGLGTRNSDGEIAITPLPIPIGNILKFERPDGMITEAKVLDYWHPLPKASNTNAGTIATYKPAEVITCQLQNYAPANGQIRLLGGGSNSGLHFDNGTIWLVSGEGIPSSTYLTTTSSFTSDGEDWIGWAHTLTDTLSVPTDVSSDNPGDNNFMPGGGEGWTTHNVTLTEVTGYYRLDSNVYNRETVLPWFNCYSFGNGLESDRIRDDFNAPKMNNGARVSTTLSNYGKERRGSSMIYSGIYNSTSGVNRLNEFNMAQSITKDLNPSTGSIQVLKTRDTNVVALCEDKIYTVLANKNALYNADGSKNVTASNTVLGDATAFAGDYGISSNPESLAIDGFRMYFTDKNRNKVIRLSQNGLTPISDAGMSSWFRDNLNYVDNLIGTFDETRGEYNLTINYTPYGRSSGSIDTTVSFSEKTKGWTSFKSFIPQAGLSINEEYITAVDGYVWSHHDKNSEANNFYNRGSKLSSINVIFNEEPGSVKNFTTINYEGTQAHVPKFSTTTIQDTEGNYLENHGLNNVIGDGEYYNLAEKRGWYVASFNTDIDNVKANNFVNKEGKWFSNLSGINRSTSSLDVSSITTQGVGILSHFTTDAGDVDTDTDYIDSNPTVSGCTNECSSNYNALATVDDGSCISYVYGCMDSNYVEYNASATISQVSCIDASDPCYTLKVYGCTDATAFNYNPNANVSDGSCVAVVLGCTNESAANYNSLANTEDGSCISFALGCTDANASNFDPAADTNASDFTLHIDGQYYFNGNPCVYDDCTDSLAVDYVQQSTFTFAKVTHENPDGTFTMWPATFTDDNCIYPTSGCTDPSANNYNSDATLDDGSCTYDPVYGCIDPTANNYDANADTDDGSCTYDVFGCMDPLATNYNPLATIDDGSCIDPIPDDLIITITEI